MKVLHDFRGDISWIHKWEGHSGKPYWPGGASGVTLDPGLDLGHADPKLVAEAYLERLSTEQFAAVQKVMGLRGEEAKQALKSNDVLSSIRVSRAEADEMFHLVARPYWNSLRKRFDGLTTEGVPGEVHTAMLSIGYNRGARNRDLQKLIEPIQQGDWHTLGSVMAAMQQDHKLEGIRRRRRAEGELIASAAA